MNGLTVTQSYGGTNGRFMDINWETIAGETTPSSSQITISSCTFTDNKSDGNGGLFKINVDTI